MDMMVKTMWNHRSLNLYLSILKKQAPIKNSEILSTKNKFNEMIMNGFISKGINIKRLNNVKN